MTNNCLCTNVMKVQNFRWIPNAKGWKRDKLRSSVLTVQEGPSQTFHSPQFGPQSETQDWRTSADTHVHCPTLNLKGKHGVSLVMLHLLGLTVLRTVVKNSSFWRLLSLQLMMCNFSINPINPNAIILVHLKSLGLLKIWGSRATAFPTLIDNQALCCTV